MIYIDADTINNVVRSTIDDDTFELTVPATNDIELVSKVLSYGVKAEPIAPEEFVENYKNEIKTLELGSIWV